MLETNLAFEAINNPVVPILPPSVSSHLSVPETHILTADVPRKPQVWLMDELPPGVLFGYDIISIDGKKIEKDESPSISRREFPVSPVGKIYLVKGLAGTGKTTTTLSKLNTPLVITKTNKLKQKFIKMDLEATTAASFLRMIPVHSPFYELKPYYRGSERDSGKEVECRSLREAADMFFYDLTGDKKYLKFWRKMPVSMMTDFLRPYYDRVVTFKQRNGISLSPKIKKDILFDDIGLYSEDVVLYLIRLFEAGAIWSNCIALTFDENQLNYGGLKLINYIKKHYSDRVEEITCYNEWRFKDSSCCWWQFDRFYSVPIVNDYAQASESIFVSHNFRYLCKARNTGGWTKKTSINIDRVQGEEYPLIAVSLLGLATLYRNKIPSYKERIYTTITRGENFIFYVPRGVSRGVINAAIRDIICALSEIERPELPMPIYDYSVLNLKNPKNYKSCMSSHFQYLWTRYCGSCPTAVGGTAVFYIKFENKKRNLNLGSVLYKPSCFWPYKPRTTALARLF